MSFRRRSASDVVDEPHRFPVQPTKIASLLPEWIHGVWKRVLGNMLDDLILSLAYNGRIYDTLPYYPAFAEYEFPDRWSRTRDRAYFRRAVCAEWTARTNGVERIGNRVTVTARRGRFAERTAAFQKYWTTVESAWREQETTMNARLGLIWTTAKPELTERSQHDKAYNQLQTWKQERELTDEDFLEQSPVRKAYEAFETTCRKNLVSAHGEWWES